MGFKASWTGSSIVLHLTLFYFVSQTMKIFTILVLGALCSSILASSTSMLLMKQECRWYRQSHIKISNWQPASETISSYLSSPCFTYKVALILGIIFFWSTKHGAPVFANIYLIRSTWGNSMCCLVKALSWMYEVSRTWCSWLS